MSTFCWVCGWVAIAALYVLLFMDATEGSDENIRRGR